MTTITETDPAFTLYLDNLHALCPLRPRANLECDWHDNGTCTRCGRTRPSYFGAS